MNECMPLAFTDFGFFSPKRYYDMQWSLDVGSTSFLDVDCALNSEMQIDNLTYDIHNSYISQTYWIIFSKFYKGDINLSTLYL